MKHKIGVIIAIQISIIVASFLVLTIYQTQSLYLGNTINTSGKNRYLAELLYEMTVEYRQSLNQSPPIDAMRNIDANIHSLSRGGVLPSQVLYPVSSDVNLEVMAVPSEFSNDLKQVQDKWTVYRTEVAAIIDSKSDDATKPDYAAIQEKGSEFIVAANNLTVDLSTYGKQQSQNLIILQISFLIVNVFAHLFLLRMILRIIKNDHVQSIILHQISSDKKQLVFETQLSNLQKDVLEGFLLSMTQDLYKLKKQVRIMGNPIENENNKITLRQITDTLLTRIKQLAESKKELDDHKSYYQQLNKKLEKSISILSKGGKDIETRNTDDLIAVMQSYFDRINILVQMHKLPPQFGKNLAKAMDEIIEHLLAVKNHK
jgi:flagellar motility protein MotE (MotC chaperone)